MAIRLGIIGTGRIAKRAVAELAHVPGIRITAVVNPNVAHAGEFARVAGIEVKCAGDIASVAEDIDAAYIAAPHGAHFTYAKELLQAGKHVICEKPMSFSAMEVTELYELAEKQRLVLMEAMKTAYCPGFLKLEELMRSGVIGEVADVDACFSHLTAPGGREYNDKEHGGAFTEFGSYGMLPVLRFLGTKWKGVSFYSRGTDGVDGYSRVVFDYGDKFASVKAGLSVKSEGGLVISGTKGYMLLPAPWWLTRRIEVHFEDANATQYYECEFEGDGLRYEFSEFAGRVAAAEAGGGEVYDTERDEAIARAEVFEKFLRARNG